MLEALTRADPAQAQATAGLLDWAAAEANIEASWSKNAANIAVQGAGGRRTILRTWTERGIGDCRRCARPPDGMTQLRRAHRAPGGGGGCALRGGRLWPKAPLAPPAQPQARHAFVAALEPALTELRAAA